MQIKLETSRVRRLLDNVKIETKDKFVDIYNDLEEFVYWAETLGVSHIYVDHDDYCWINILTRGLEND